MISPCPDLKYFNDKFLNAQGHLIGFRNDDLHSDAQGYEIWVAAVAPTFKSWIK